VTDTKVYDRTTDSGGAPIIVSGLVAGDSVTGLAQSFDNRNAGPRTLSIDAGYTVSDGNGGGNYDVTLDTASGSITPAPLELSAVTDTKVYTGNTDSSGAPIGVSGLVAGDNVTGLAQSFDSRNAGPRTLTINAGYVVADGNGGGNYDVTLDTAAGSITPAPLTLAAVTDTRVYDGKTSSDGTPLATGLVGGDDVLGLGQVFDSRNAGPRTLSISAGYAIDDGNGGNNYAVTLTTALGSITPAPLTLAAITDTKVYDRTTTSGGAPDAIGLVSGDSISGLGQSFDDRNAGPRTLAVNTGYVIADGNGGLNYTVSESTAAGAITPAPLELSAVTDTKVYNGDVASGGAPIVVSGLVSGDTVTGLDQVFDSRNAGARQLGVSAYTVNDGNGGNNYSVTLDGAAGSITPAPLTLSAVGQSRVYDGLVDSSSAPIVVSGLVSGDTVSGLTQVFDSRNAGSRQLQVSAYAINDGNSGANYSVTLNTALGSITPAPLTIAAVSDTRVYDGTIVSTAGPTAIGLVTTDTVTGLSQAFDSRNAGARTLAVKSGYTVDDGNGGANYAVTVATASGAITPASLVLTTATDTKVYDQNTTSVGTPQAVGLVAGDSVTGLGQTFDSANAGARTLILNPGYTLIDGNGGANYTVTLAQASGTITPAPITATMSGLVYKLYDGTTVANLTPVTYQFSGVLGGDQVTLNTPGVGAYDTPAEGAGKLVTALGLTLGGADAGNYAVSSSISAPIGVICLSACITPPTYTEIFSDLTRLRIVGLQFQLPMFVLNTDLPTDPDDNKGRKGDLFPVTGAGNRDLWTHPAGVADGQGAAP
jgi:hypothetical protein